MQQVVDTAQGNRSTVSGGAPPAPDPTGVLARKAARGRAEGGAQPVAMTPPRALALALARCADTDLALPLRIQAVTPCLLSLADLPEAIMEQALIAVVEGPGDGLGVVALCPITVASLIEVQTMGRLSHRPVQTRRPTRTDAALTAPFVDAALSAFETLLEGIGGQEWAAGYRYASFLDDPRPLGMMFEDVALRGLTVEMALGADGQRSGRLLLALPAQSRAAEAAGNGAGGGATAVHPAAQAAQAAAIRAAEHWRRTLSDRVMPAEITLNGVLARLALPVSQLMALQPGQLLALPDGAVQALSVEVAGRAIAQARLGQHRGARALRLIDAEADGAQVADSGQGGLSAGMATVSAASAGGWADPAAALGGMEGSMGMGSLGAATLGDAPAEWSAALPLDGGALSQGRLTETGDLPPLGALPMAPLAMAPLDLGGLLATDEAAGDAAEDVGGLDALAPLPMKIGAFG